MGELADILVESNERAEPPAPLMIEQKTSNPKTGIKKPRKQVFGKVAARQISAQVAELQSAEVHRAYGERGDFEKVTVTIPSEVRGLLLEESLRRKKDRSADWPIAAIVREAIAAYLSPKQ
jgi:hypothetical protein